MKHKCPETKAGAPDWIVTFADLMSLLMTFFVLLLSFSSMEVSKFNTMAGAIKSALGMRSPLDLSRTPTSPRIIPAPNPADNAIENANNRDRLMMVRLRRALEESGMTEHGKVKADERGITLELEGDLLFDSGKSSLRPDAVAVLQKIAEVAAKSGRELEVQGHTDDVPISSTVFPSNWELSTARAGSAVRHLTSKGLPPSRVKAVGFADTRPLAANDSPENRAKNRRVEFLFLNPTPGSAGA